MYVCFNLRYYETKDDQKFCEFCAFKLSLSELRECVPFSLHRSFRKNRSYLKEKLCDSCYIVDLITIETSIFHNCLSCKVLELKIKNHTSSSNNLRQISVNSGECGSFCMCDKCHFDYNLPPVDQICYSPAPTPPISEDTETICFVDDSVDNEIKKHSSLEIICVDDDDDDCILLMPKEDVVYISDDE